METEVRVGPTRAGPATSSSILATFTDSAGYNAAPNGSVSTLTTSTLNTTFRGIALIPAAATPIHNPGDTNSDGVVDLADLNNVLNNFGSPGTLGDDNGNGTVELGDLNNVLNNFGTHYAASALSAVPEPASLSLLALGATSLLARRRRRPR